MNATGESSQPFTQFPFDGFVLRFSNILGAGGVLIAIGAVITNRFNFSNSGAGVNVETTNTAVIVAGGRGSLVEGRIESLIEPDLNRRQYIGQLGRFIRGQSAL